MIVYFWYTLASIEAEPDHKGNIFETRLTQQQHYFNLRNFPLTWVCREYGINFDIIDYYHAPPRNCSELSQFFQLNWERIFWGHSQRDSYYKQIALWLSIVLCNYVSCSVRRIPLQLQHYEKFSSFIDTYRYL